MQLNQHTFLWLRTKQAKFSLLLLVILCQYGSFTFAQERAGNDSIRTQTLNQVTVKGVRSTVVTSLPAVHGTYLMGGKRSEVIRLSEIDANVAEKTPRLVFARIPGVFVYDMDGTGNQINVSTRGLDPHRSWENNIRQNGVITNSDMYGYPASHYSPPMESIDRVELVRGTASLQYGAQFGGMLNYVTKGADTTRRFGFETINSVGTYGLLSSYNAIGGRVGNGRTTPTIIVVIQTATGKTVSRNPRRNLAVYSSRRPNGWG